MLPVFTAHVYLLWTSQDKQKSERCWEMKKMADFNNWPPSILAHSGPTKGPGGASGAIAKVNPLGTSLLIPPQCQKTTFCDFGFWTRTLLGPLSSQLLWLYHEILTVHCLIDCLCSQIAQTDHLGLVFTYFVRNEYDMTSFLLSLNSVCSPGFATIDLYSHERNSSVLRAIDPEVSMIIGFLPWILFFGNW